MGQNLAISYVNESLDLAALTTLHRFLLLLHPSHAGPPPQRQDLTDTSSPWHLHERVRDAYLRLAKDQYTQNGHVDPDVQVGLGTLYYMMGEYGEARDCWVAALEERPDVRLCHDLSDQPNLTFMTRTTCFGTVSELPWPTAAIPKKLWTHTDERWSCDRPLLVPYSTLVWPVSQLLWTFAPPILADRGDRPEHRCPPGSSRALPRGPVPSRA